MVESRHRPNLEPRKWAALAFFLALPILSAQVEAPDQELGRVVEFEKELQGPPDTGLSPPDGTKKDPQPSASSQEAELWSYKDDEEVARLRKPLSSSCDLWSGRWVYDPSYPLYQPESCRLGLWLYDCTVHKRPDKYHQHFRWQPDDCTIPRFNAAKARESLWGKRLIILGDSLGLNMQRSLLCMLSSDLPDVKGIVREHGTWHAGVGFNKRTLYYFKKFNFTLEMFWSRFLVQLEELPEHVKDAPREVKQVLYTGVMDAAATSIVNASVDLGFGFDRNTILVVNSGHWWTEDQLSRKGVYYLAPDGRSVNTSTPLEEAFEASMRTAARWLLAMRQQYGVHIMWRTYSPSHFRGGKWNTGGWCSAQLPLKGRTSPSLMRGPEGQQADLDPLSRKVMVAAGLPLMDIRALSNLRVDGHPGIFHGKEGKQTSDCAHWCLPGVADTWNELFMAQLSTKSLLAEV